MDEGARKLKRIGSIKEIAFLLREPSSNSVVPYITVAFRSLYIAPVHSAACMTVDAVVDICIRTELTCTFLSRVSCSSDGAVPERSGLGVELRTLD